MRLFIMAIDLAVIAIIGWFFITQIIVPAWKGVKLFPMFNKRRQKLEDSLIETREREDLKALRSQSTGRKN